MTTKEDLDRVVESLFGEVTQHPTGATVIQFQGESAAYWEKSGQVEYRISGKAGQESIRRVAWELLMWKIDLERGN